MEFILMMKEAMFCGLDWNISELWWDTVIKEKVIAFFLFLKGQILCCYALSLVF